MLRVTRPHVDYAQSFLKDAISMLYSILIADGALVVLLASFEELESV